MIKEYFPKDIESLISIFNGFNNSFMFRGHLDDTWKIESTLSRVSSIKNSKLLSDLEEISFVEFASKFDIYNNNAFKKEERSRFDYLSLMQHFGVPTRLIDFTLSPYIALYFIIENFVPSEEKETNFAIYAINFTKLNNIFLEYIKNSSELYKDYDLFKLNINSELIFKDFFQEHTEEVLFMANEPPNSNARIDRQKGTFLISTYCTDIIKELSSKKYKEIQFSKITIPVSLYEKIYHLLRQVNINPKVLYGDLVGLSKSLKNDMAFNSFLAKKANPNP